MSKGDSKNEWSFDKKLNIAYLVCFIATFLLVMAAFIYVLSVEAADLGVYGKSYPIDEADIEEEIARKLSIYEESWELKKFQENYQKAVTKQIKQPNRVMGIRDAEENRTRKYDPTSYLEEDILVPKGGMSQVDNIKVSEGKEVEYEVLHKAGTAINPLKYMRFNEPLIFVDGNNEQQLEYARKYKDKNPAAKIILIDGKPGYHEVKGNEYYYYYDQWGAYSEKFKIAFVPSIVWQKEGEEVLTVDEIKIEEGE